MENNKPVLVAGATGYLGMEICRQLIAANKNVRGLVRSTSDPSKVDALKEIGVNVVKGDLKDRESLRPALKGIKTVISSATAIVAPNKEDNIESVDLNGQLNLVAASKDEGVEQFIYISFPESAEIFPLQNAKRTVERAIQEAGFSFTILRPTFFMEMWLSPAVGFDYTNHKATIYGEGKNKISWISIRDVAAFAVASLVNPEATNAIIELGGPEPLSPDEVVQIFEQTGQPFEVIHVTETDLSAQLKATSDPVSQTFSALMLMYARGSEIDMKDKLRKFSIRPSSVREYSNQVMSQQEVAEAH